MLSASALTVTTVICAHNLVTLSPMGIDGPLCRQSINIAYSSYCPSSAWQHAIGSTMHPLLTFFDVGSNKGYTTNELLLRFDAKWQISQQEWHEFLLTYTNNSFIVDGCGYCGDCASVVNKSAFGQVKVIAVEMMTKTAEMLNATFNQFNVPGMVVHAAASDDDGYASEPVEVLMGETSVGIQQEGRPVPQFKLDTLARRLNVDTIDFLHIDTEGYDPLVLNGAASLLQSQKIRVLEFEYHGKGPWLGTLLRDVVDQLRAYGYTCFFEGSSGAFTPLLPQCGLLYEFHKWSNLVCSHDQSVLSVLKSFVPPFLNS